MDRRICQPVTIVGGLAMNVAGGRGVMAKPEVLVHLEGILVKDRPSASSQEVAGQ